MEQTRHRKQIDPRTLASTMRAIGLSFAARLRQKGPGISVTTHEILGIVTEEVRELEAAVHAGDPDKVHAELVDLAVACALGIASIQTGVEW